MMNAPMPEDFASLGFAAGVVRGIRAFNIGEGTSNGILMGVVYRQWWGSGEVTAMCFKSHSAYSRMYNNGLGLDCSLDSDLFVKPDHDMSQCLHGLYAFYDGSNDYAKTMESRVSGVIEGYGETMIGPRGFRSSKARIVALCSSGDYSNIYPNYDTIPWFNSAESMLKEFPLGEFLE